jgi:hypothetical protein
VHDAPAFVLHFHFLLGVAVGQKGIDMRQDIEGDRMRVNFGGGRAFFGCRLYLRSQFFDGARPAAGYGLVTGGHHAPHAKREVKRVKRHERDGGRAVRIGNQSAMLPDIVAVDLGDHERHVRVHPEHGGIIDNDCAGLAGDRCKFPGDVAAGAEKGNVDSGKGFRGKFGGGDLLGAEGDGRSCRTLGAQRTQGLDRKRAPLQNAQQFNTHRASRANHRDVIAFPCVSHSASYRRLP